MSNMNIEIEAAPPTADEELLLWRRLNLSKAKLKGVTEMAALMAGFSVVATVELDINEGDNEYLLVSFAVTTAFLVSTTMMSIMICTCILPYIDAVTKLNHYGYAKNIPHEDLIKYIDLSWVLANTISIFLFLVDVVIISWIKFGNYPVAASCTTFVIAPVLITLAIFTVIFYRQSVQHQINISDKKCYELELLSKRLHDHSSSQSSIQTV